MKLFPGFRFKPLDDELISFYLSNKINGKPLPSDVVGDCDLYGDRPPWDICLGRKPENCYFFTHLRKASKNRIARTVAGGEWHGNTCGKQIVDRITKKVIGLRKQFTFKPKKEKNMEAAAGKTSWIMHEYSLVGERRNSNDEYVLCHIIKHEKGKKTDDDGGDVDYVSNGGFDQVDAIQDYQNMMSDSDQVYVGNGGLDQVGAIQDDQNLMSDSDQVYVCDGGSDQAGAIQDDQNLMSDQVYISDGGFDQAGAIQDDQNWMSDKVYVSDGGLDQAGATQDDQHLMSDQVYVCNGGLHQAGAIQNDQTLMCDQVYATTGDYQFSNKDTTTIDQNLMVVNQACENEGDCYNRDASTVGGVNMEPHHQAEPEWIYLQKGWFYDVDPAEIARMSACLDDLIAKQLSTPGENNGTRQD